MLKRLTIVLLVLALVACVLPAQAVTLRRGSRGSEVIKLQTALKELGFYKMSVDGVFGKGTLAAVLAFQRANGLKADGIAGPKTWAKLNEGGGSEAAAAASTPAAASAPAASTPAASSVTAASTATKLQQGDSGDAVRQLQTKLWYIGYYTGSINGSFDAATREAVIDFQRAKGLVRDGIAGKKTLGALDTACTNAKSLAGSIPDEAAAILNRIAVESGASCGTLVLSKDGKVFLTWSFGGVSENTCFRIASITKWVTAIGLMTLYDDGKLDLDRDISDYLGFKVRNPAYPDTPITARMLLSHTSSLSPNATVYKPNWERIGVNGYDPLFDESVKPGTKYAYADYNGALFGCLIEAISGESVQDYLDRKVFKPLGLTAAYSPSFLPSGTDFKDTLGPTGKVTLPVSGDRTSYNNTADPRGNNGNTVGRLYINTASLTILAQMMMNGGELNGVRILNRATVTLMESDQPGLAASKYGLSTVRQTQFPRGTWYGHQGRYSGLTSNVYYQVDTGITLALVMNGYDYKLEDNVVLPAVTLMKNMEKIEKLCVTGE